MAKVKVNLKGLKATTSAVKSAVEEAIHDCADDLIRTSSESAPHWKGILEQSYGKSAGWSGTKFVAIVDYSVKEENGNGGFNYALYIHEDESYELGEKSEEKASKGGGVGMSGKSYAVDRKFLTRPLQGESDTYIKHVQNMIDEAVK